MEFARIGMVPVHVLRGLEVAGLLVPRRMGPGSGRRWYDARQLPRLNRILVLTDLGFTFPQVRAILDTRMSEHELRGVLRLRRAELAARVSADAVRLERVEARLAAIADDADAEPADEGQEWWATPAQRAQRARAWRRRPLTVLAQGGRPPWNPPLRCAPARWYFADTPVARRA